MLIKTYFAKPFLPRIFGYQSLPLIVVFLAVVEVLHGIRDAFKEQRVNKTILFEFIVLTYLAVYFLRSSHSRYLLSLIPLIIIFFLKFIKMERKVKGLKVNNNYFFSYLFFL